MACKKKGFTLLELVIVIFIMGLVITLIISVLHVFSKSSSIYKEKGLLLHSGTSITDFIIGKLDRTNICISKFREFNTYSEDALIMVYKDLDKYESEQQEDDDEYEHKLKKYGIIEFRESEDRLYYIEIAMDKFNTEVSRNEILLGENVDEFKVAYEQGIPENSFFVWFSFVLYYEGTEKKVTHKFVSGEYLRNKR